MSVVLQDRGVPSGMRERRQHIPIIGTVTKKRATDAGWDLHAAIEAPLTVLRGHSYRIPTDVRTKIPVGYYARVTGRSSLHDRGIFAIEGTIDATYTGFIYVRVIGAAVGDDMTWAGVIQPGDRIAQLILCPIVPVCWHQVVSIDEKLGDRGFAGHGSTGR